MINLQMMPSMLPMHGGDQIEIIATASQYEGSAMTISVPVPSGTADGDLLVAVIGVPGTGTSFTAPMGWALDINSPDGGGSIYIATKIAASEGASATFTWGASNGASALMITVRNASAIQCGTVARETGPGTISAPGFSAAQNGLLLAFFSSVFPQASVSTPSGMVATASVPGQLPSLFAFSQMPSPSGPTGDRSTVFSTNYLVAVQAQIS